MHRLAITALAMLGALVAADSVAEAQFGFCRRSCGYGGYYGPGPIVYGYGGFGPFYSGYGFSGVSFGGLNVGVATVGPYPYPYAPAYPYPVYPVGYPYIAAPAPVFVQPQPVFVQPGAFNNPVINEWMPRQGVLQQGELRQGGPRQGEGNVQPAPEPQAAPEVAGQQPPRQAVDPQLLLRPITLEARRRAVRAIAVGDEAVRAQNWNQAYIKYKEAANAAGDQAEPHFRMALTLTMMNRFNIATDAFKRGLQINPGWPATATLLDQFLGERNVLAKQVMLSRLTNWVREDVRDPDRLFLVGVMLFLDQDVSRSHQFLKTANELAGSPAYVQAFLNVQPVAGQQNDQVIVPADQRQPATSPPVAIPPAARPPAPQLQGDEPNGPQVPVAPRAAPEADGPALTVPQALPEAPPPKAAVPGRAPVIEPQLPPVTVPPAKPAGPELPQSFPNNGAVEELDRVVPVLPAPKRAAVGESLESPLQGPKLGVPDDELSVPQPVASRVKFKPAPMPRSTAVIFRGRQRYEFFPRAPRQPAADVPTVIEDVYSR